MPGGANIGFGDGSVKFVADTIDIEVWRQLGNRADGKLLDVHFPDCPLVSQWQLALLCRHLFDLEGGFMVSEGLGVPA